jgi:hypothetical protein
MKIQLKSEIRNPKSEGCPKSEIRHGGVPRWTLALAALGVTTLPAGAWDLATNLTLKAEVGVKETYDSNVYLQDGEPLPGNVAAAQAAGFRPVEANKGSFVTSILPKIGLDFKPCSAFNVALGYAPEISYYHSAHGEDNTAHRGTLNFTGKAGDATWEFANTAIYIDGSTTGPVFARPDDIPAVGGIPLRDRRAAFIFKNGFKITKPVGDWFFRPVATSYIHDFKTDQLYQTSAQKSQFSYENYIDRQEISGGLDVGYQVAKGTHLVLGYRYGRQEQYKGYDGAGRFVSSPYDSTFHRFLVGVEGSPAPWLKLAALAGPDLRVWDDPARLRQMYPTFDHNKMLYYFDVSATVIPTKQDTVTLKSLRYEQPSFASFGMYEDTKTDLAWKHKFTDQFTAGVGFTLYIGDWQQPVHRDDWIYTPNVSLAYAFTKHLSGEFAYSYDWVDSKFHDTYSEPLTKNHEFTRHLASLGVKYIF